MIRDVSPRIHRLNLVMLASLTLTGWSCLLMSLSMGADPSITCLDRLRKIGQATLIYAAQNDDRIPPAVTSGIEWPQHRRGTTSRPAEWKAMLSSADPLDPSVFLCPALDTEKLGRHSFEGEDASISGYKTMFLAFLGPLTGGKLQGWQAVDEQGNVKLSLSQIEDPRRAPYATDVLFQVPRSGRVGLETGHGAYIARLYFDGHATMSLRLESRMPPPDWRKPGGG